MTTQDNEPLIVYFPPDIEPETRVVLFEHAWTRAFGSLANPATRTIAIVEHIEP